MYVVLLRLFLLSVFVCHTSGLLNHDNPGTPSLNDVLDSLNGNNLVPEKTITIGHLKTVILALQKDYTSRLNTLKSDFELSLRSQQNRIRYLEKKVAYQEKLINFLENGESFKSRQTHPENNPQPHVQNASDNREAFNSTGYYSLDIKEMQQENWSKEMSGRPKRERQERLLIQEIPTSSAVVALYAYMSKDLPANVATPHHVLIFDAVRTNIGNAYHSSTGVFIVPETGVYVFVWSFMNGSSAYHSIQLMVNTAEWVYGSFSSGLLHHDDKGKLSVNAVLDGLNDKDTVLEQKITTGDPGFKRKLTHLGKIKTESYSVSRKGSSSPKKLINFLKNGESIISRQTRPENSQHEHNASDAFNSPEGYPVKIKEMKKTQNIRAQRCRDALNEANKVVNSLRYEIYSKLLQVNVCNNYYQADLILTERLLIQEIPPSSAVVALYAYISTSLPANVATPHHVIIFDEVRTNIGNAYHSSIVPDTGVYVFIWSFMNVDADEHSTQLIINTEEWGIVHANSASNSLMQSDVFLKTSETSRGEINSGVNRINMFAGWKIH